MRGVVQRKANTSKGPVSTEVRTRAETRERVKSSAFGSSQEGEYQNSAKDPTSL